MIVKTALRSKLHQELINGGIDAKDIIVLAIDQTEIGVNLIFNEGVDMSLVQSIVDAHNPTPPTPLLTDIEQLRLEMARSNAEMFETILSMTGGV